MIEPTDDGVAMSGPAVAPVNGAGGNGAPPWVDDATNARYTHYARLPLHAMVGLDPELALVLDAHFIGCTPQRLQEIRRDQLRSLDATAASLVRDPAFAADLATFAERTGPRLVVVGDSITADSLGWAELLGACFRAAATRVGGDLVTVVNMAVSGFTTSETIPLFHLVVREAPTCVLAMLGTNDGRRQGAVADVRTVSSSETQRNLLALRTLAEEDASARFLAIAPPPMHQARYDASVAPAAPVRFSSEDLTATLAAVREALPEAVDLPALLGDGLPPDFWLPDGLHPSQEGQAVLLRHIVHAVAVTVTFTDFGRARTTARARTSPLL